MNKNKFGKKIKYDKSGLDQFTKVMKNRCRKEEKALKTFKPLM